jgi:hypothetical protein
MRKNQLRRVDMRREDGSSIAGFVVRATVPLRAPADDEEGVGEDSGGDDNDSDGDGDEDGDEE